MSRSGGRQGRQLPGLAPPQAVLGTADFENTRKSEEAVCQGDVEPDPLKQAGCNQKATEQQAGKGDDLAEGFHDNQFWWLLLPFIYHTSCQLIGGKP